MNLAGIVSLSFAGALAVLCWIRRSVLPGGLADGVVLGVLSCAGPAIATLCGLDESTGLLSAGIVVSVAGAMLSTTERRDLSRVAGATLIFFALLMNLGSAAAEPPSPIRTLHPVLALLVFGFLAIGSRHWIETYALMLTIPLVNAAQYLPIDQRFHLDWVLLVLTLIVLTIVVGGELLRWHKRRRIWSTEMKVLPRTPIDTGQGFLTATLTMTLLIAIPGGISPLAPITFTLAALAVASWAHIRETGRLAEMLLPAGLALGVMAAGLSIPAWIDNSWAGWRLGLVIAGSWAAWLARFWEQQLLNHQPWTSAGRLIPTARRLALSGSLGVAALGLASTMSTRPAEHAPWLNTVALLGLVYLMLTQLAESSGPGGITALLGAMLAAIGIGTVGRDLLHVAGVTIDPLLSAAFVGLGIALLFRVPRYAGGRSHSILLNAVFCGILPVVVLFQVSGPNPAGQRLAALGVAACAAALCVRLDFQPGREQQQTLGPGDSSRIDSNGRRSSVPERP